MSSTSKAPVSRLPLPDSSRILTHNLTPDPLSPSVQGLVDTMKTRPTALRRSQATHDSSHFAYLSPLPLPFPYRIAPPPSDTPSRERALYIERVLSTQEALTEAPEVSTEAPNNGLKKYQSPEREVFPRELLSIAPSSLRDCFPHLDVGDAIKYMGPGQLSGEASPRESGTENEQAIRQELVDILSGNAVLMAIPNDDTSQENGYAPWSLRYSGHQFGSWAGQLGDGRAISILETPLPGDPSTTYELQLKGAGRTMFSRGADGLAVLRSSVREYLVAEAMHALGIPTTRSLSLISLPTLPVAREQQETAAIVCRVAESFIRIGNFQALNSSEPDVSFIFLGASGGSFAQQPPNYEALRLLGEWVTRKVLKLDIESGAPWAKKLVWECARRNALMCAGWQAYGFMHGVMNTDNISILGLTIDYGPYAFMDVFSHDHVCNHTDEIGRYSYKHQPTMIVYALRMLLRSLAPVIGAELESGKAVTEDCADVSKLKSWSAKAQEMSEELEQHVVETFSEEYWRLMRQRLGLRTEQTSDHPELFAPLLDLMEKHAMDFHITFRHLTTFRASWMEPMDSDATNDALEAFLRTLLQSNDDEATPGRDISIATRDWIEFLERYAARIYLDEELHAWKSSLATESRGDWERMREVETKKYNPRFVLRQWVLEEVIAALQSDAEAVNAGIRTVDSPSKARQMLNKILEMSTSPFEPWGEEGNSVTTDEEREERRLCGTGPKKMLGFQCSCSS
ncbi:hypothetical protein FRB99_007877 [Tulasnella sp. 403]|nr:hypothetical protein FRB99_007877 [Tulasnella sp. 403]